MSYQYLPLIGVFAVFYILIGAALSFGLVPGSNLVGRLVSTAIWPYALAVDGTPRIRWLTHLSGVEVVIEETTALDGSTIIQTVRHWTGNEYTREKF